MVEHLSGNATSEGTEKRQLARWHSGLHTPDEASLSLSTTMVRERTPELSVLRFLHESHAWPLQLHTPKSKNDKHHHNNTKNSSLTSSRRVCVYF